MPATRVMHQEDLGLPREDSRRTSPRDYMASVLLSAVLVVVALVVTPVASRPGFQVQGFMPAFGGAMMVINLVIAALLFSKGAIGGTAAPIRLGTAYFFAGIIIIPHVAAMPGAIMPHSLIGASATAVWLWSFWHTGFALAIIRHALLARSAAPPGSISRSMLWTVAIVACLVAASVLGLPYLPVIVTEVNYFSDFTACIPLAVILTNLLALCLVVVRLRLRSVEDLWLAVAMLAALVDVWLTFRAGSRFTLGWYTSRVASLLTSLVVLVSQLRDITRLYSQVAVANRMLSSLVRLDGLTGLANRRHLDETIAMEWRRAQRDGRPLSLVLLDVDHFKRFNDRYGHLEGDECLRRLGERLRAVARRPGDLAARYGGEEFMLVLPATDSAGATQLANELRLAVRNLAIAHADSAHQRVTISVGLTTLHPGSGQSVEALMKQADAALYHAKEAGRDQVQVSPSCFDITPRLQKAFG